MTTPFDPRPETRPAPAGGPAYDASLVTPEQFSQTLTGAQSTGTGKATFRNTTGDTLEITAVSLHAGTAPTGAALIVDVNANGTSVFTAGGRPQIAAGATDGSAAPNVAADTVAPNQTITVDIDQVGSTVAGSDLTVVVEAIRVPTGGISWKDLRDGYVAPNIREAELLPLDVNPA